MDAHDLHTKHGNENADVNDYPGLREFWLLPLCRARIYLDLLAVYHPTPKSLGLEHNNHVVRLMHISGCWACSDCLRSAWCGCGLGTFEAAVYLAKKCLIEVEAGKKVISTGVGGVCDMM